MKIFIAEKNECFYSNTTIKIQIKQESLLVILWKSIFCLFDGIGNFLVIIKEKVFERKKTFCVITVICHVLFTFSLHGFFWVLRAR